MSFSNTGEFLNTIIEDFRDPTALQDADIESVENSDEGEESKEKRRLAKQRLLKDKFLYKFFAGPKDKKAENWRNNPDVFSPNDKYDKYIYIRSMYLAFKAGKKTEEEYRAAFKKVIADTDKKSKRSRFPSALHSDLLYRDPGKAQSELEFRLLKDCVDTFIDNAQRSKHFSDKSSSNSEKHIDIIEMLNEFHKYCEDTDYERIGIVSNKYLGECGKLYEMIEDPENDIASAFIPLYIDSKSGAGVYLIKGFSKLSNEASVCILSFDGILEKEISTEDFPFSMRIVEKFSSRELKQINRKRENEGDNKPENERDLRKKAEEAALDCIKNAFDLFEGYIDSDECFYPYMDYNITGSFGNIGNSFLPYFDLPDEERIKIMENENAKEKADMDKRKAKGEM